MNIFNNNAKGKGALFLEKEGSIVMFKVIEVKTSIYERNNEVAAQLRRDLAKQGTYFMNLMSSPGSGKTTMLKSLLGILKEELEICVMEADIDSDVDAKTISDLGVKTIQLHTGGMCHVDAMMTRHGMQEVGMENIDFCVLENVGNLICTAGYDLGANLNTMILSVPEGHDKPLKYPKMFTVCDLLIVSKIDVAPYFDFDFEALKESVLQLNPNMKIITVSAKDGTNMEELAAYIKKEVMLCKNKNQES